MYTIMDPVQHHHGPVLGKCYKERDKIDPDQSAMFMLSWVYAGCVCLGVKYLLEGLKYMTKECKLAFVVKLSKSCNVL